MRIQIYIPAAVFLSGCSPQLYSTLATSAASSIGYSYLGPLLPVTSAATLNVAYSSSQTGTLRSSNPNHSVLTYSIVTPPTKGTVVINDASTGSYTYTANVGTGGTDTFSFKTVDSQTGNSNASWITVNVANSLCPPTKAVFFASGGDQYFALPASCSATPYMHVKMWGGGGGGGFQGGTSEYNSGGGGGYAAADMSVAPGSTYVVMVGVGGPWANPSQSQGYTYGGGGIGVSVGGYIVGGGGGRSAISLAGTELITAGGGGGAGTTSTYTAATNISMGGAGGGLTGQDGTGAYLNATGTGGGQTYGGGGSLFGSQFLGAGNNTAYQAGGGGGYFGGGSGWGQSGTVGPGGGGSSYIGGAGLTNAVTLGGTFITPGNYGDPDEGNYWAVGGYGGGGISGLVVIYYGAAQIVSLTNTSGSVSGGTVMQVTGLGFYPGTNVTVGGVSCTNITITSLNQLSCTVPAMGSPGAVDVVLTAPGATPVTWTGGFTYL